MTMLWTLHWLNKHTCFTRIQRGCSAAYYLRANSPRRACAEGDPTVSGQDGEMLRMVEEPEDGDSSETVLRSLDELQPGGNVNHVIPRRYGCAYTLFQGRLYVTGGLMADNRLSSQVDVVDVGNGETNNGPPMRHPRHSHAAAASATSLFVFGGVGAMNSCEVFNPQMMQWINIPNMPTGRWNASALCLQSGPEAVLVVGGEEEVITTPPHSPGLHQCAELLEALEGEGDAWQWRRLSNMHEGRNRRPGMLLLQAGGDQQRVLVAGGGSSTAEILQLSCSDHSDRGQWTLIAPLTMRFSSTSLVEWSDRIFAFDSNHSVNELTSNAPGPLTMALAEDFAWIRFENLQNGPIYIFALPLE